MVRKRHQAWRNLMVAAVLMTGSPANANDRAVHAAYCEQVALELYNKFSAIPPSLIPAFDPDLHAAVVKEHNEILVEITREYRRFKDYADACGAQNGCPWASWLTITDFGPSAMTGISRGDGWFAFWSG